MSPTEQARPPSGCLICSMIERIGAGTFPDYIAELPQSYVILGNEQYYRGYCVLLARHHVTELYLIPADEVRAMIDEVRLVAEAIAELTHPWKMNYSCLGNQEPHVHWHLHPRYETDSLRHGPVWMRPEAERRIALSEDDRRHLIDSLRSRIAARIPNARFPAR